MDGGTRWPKGTQAQRLVQRLFRKACKHLFGRRQLRTAALRAALGPPPPGAVNLGPGSVGARQEIYADSLCTGRHARLRQIHRGQAPGPAARVPFIDLDHQLEQVLKTSIRQFLKPKAKRVFATSRPRCWPVTAQPGGMVLSTGGGAVLRPENRQVLRDFGNVLYLRASPKEIFKRVKHDRTRPPAGEQPLQKLRELYAQRDALYRGQPPT